MPHAVAKIWCPSQAHQHLADAKISASQSQVTPLDELIKIVQYCVGGCAAMWGLFLPRWAVLDMEELWPHAACRINMNMLNSEFLPDVHKALLEKYYGKAEKMMKLAYPSMLPPHQALIDRLNLRTNVNLPFTQWQWGWVASEFHDSKNFDFTEGAFSTINTLLGAAMNDPTREKDKDFHTVPNISMVHLEPTPQPNQQTEVTHVVIKDIKNGDLEHKIACRQAIICAGSVESPAILLRSVDGDLSRYGSKFINTFGHVTDHHILAVMSPFFYHNMAD